MMPAESLEISVACRQMSVSRQAIGSGYVRAIGSINLLAIISARSGTKRKWYQETKQKGKEKYLEELVRMLEPSEQSVTNTLAV